MNYKNLFSLGGKVALITGAAQGIGKEISTALGQLGASVILTDVASDTGDKTVNELRALGIQAEFLTHDVTQEEHWQTVIAHIKKHYGSLDILVNNAGIESAALITQCELEDFNKVMEVNVTGVFLGHKHALPIMNAGASIINLSSVAGNIGTTAHIAYHTSKGAVRVMTKAAAIECAQLGLGVRVNSIHPAIIKTDMGNSFINGFVDLGIMPDKETADAAISALHPSGYGSPQDVASAAVFLASDASRWVTGIELMVDGGLTAA